MKRLIFSIVLLINQIQADEFSDTALLATERFTIDNTTPNIKSESVPEKTMEEHSDDHSSKNVIVLSKQNLEIIAKSNSTEIEQPIIEDLTFTNPRISDEKVQEIQMLLALRDVIRIDSYLQNLMRQVNKRIFGDLENSLLIHRFSQSYQMYEMVLNMLKNYKENKDNVDEKAAYLQKVITFSLNYIQSADSSLMSVVLEGQTPEQNMQNKITFVEILEKMKKEVEIFTTAISKDLVEQFQTIDEVHKNKTLSDLQKIHLLTDNCLNLVVHKKETIQPTVVKLMDLRRLVLSNPKYHVFLSKIKEDKIMISSSWRISFIFTVILAFFMLK